MPIKSIGENKKLTEKQLLTKLRSKKTKGITKYYERYYWIDYNNLTLNYESVDKLSNKEKVTRYLI